MEEEPSKNRRMSDFRINEGFVDPPMMSGTTTEESSEKKQEDKSLQGKDESYNNRSILQLLQQLNEKMDTNRDELNKKIDRLRDEFNSLNEKLDKKRKNKKKKEIELNLKIEKNGDEMEQGFEEIVKRTENKFQQIEGNLEKAESRYGEIGTQPTETTVTSMIHDIEITNIKKHESSCKCLNERNNNETQQLNEETNICWNMEEALEVQSKMNYPRASVIKMCLKEDDVQLHENVRKRALFEKGANMSEDKETEKLYKKVRGVLNKLAPPKFITFASQICDLNIDTVARLQGVVNLVYEKATEEPNFSVGCAHICRHLALMKVPVDIKQKEEFVNFRQLLVSKCQQEFEVESINDTVLAELAEIEDCTDPKKNKPRIRDKKKQLKLEEYNRRLTMKRIANIRFIGELFKQQMLTVNVMLRCLTILLQIRDEESLECLCMLLTTIGKVLEIEKKVDLSHYFITMKEIANKNDGKVSSKVRSTIQDVIDFRLSHWVPEVHLMIQAWNSVPITPRRDER